MILVGGVGQLWQGDLDLGRRAVELLAPGSPPDVIVEDLFYGAVAVAQRLEELGPDRLVLVGAAERGRPPGTVDVRLLPTPDRLGAESVQGAVADAVTGYVSIDLLVEVAAGFGVLPADTVAVEVEPASCAPSLTLSPEASAALPVALARVREVVARPLGTASLASH
jgi:hydrogenase maturation protease